MITIKINTDEIPETGLKLTEKVDVAKCDLNSDEVVFVEPIMVEVVAEKNRTTVNIKAHLVTLVKMRCARCLEWYEVKVDKDVIKDYQVSESRLIELWEGLREDLILDYPIKPLCSQDCKGLCCVCGQNLNQSYCEHSR